MPATTSVSYEVHTDNDHVQGHFRHEPGGDEDCPGAVLYQYDTEEEAREAIGDAREPCLADQADPAPCRIDRFTVTQEEVAEVPHP
ncbi:MAG: hypothetical protein ACHQ2Y_04330 [Candidatus Lutacidiplasmatales archaeon]